MRIIGEDKEYIYFVDFFEGKQMRFSLNKKTDEVLLNSEDMAVALGFNSLSELLESNPKIADAYLDCMNNGMVKKI